MDGPDLLFGDLGVRDNINVMIWAVNRYVQRYRLTDRPLASTPLWAAPWIQLRRASHYSIIKIIIQLDNSKSIWLYLFYIMNCCGWPVPCQLLGMWGHHIGYWLHSQVIGEISSCYYLWENIALMQGHLMWWAWCHQLPRCKTKPFL